MREFTGFFLKKKISPLLLFGDCLIGSHVNVIIKTSDIVCYCSESGSVQDNKHFDRGDYT